MAGRSEKTVVTLLDCSFWAPTSLCEHDCTPVHGSATSCDTFAPAFLSACFNELATSAWAESSGRTIPMVLPFNSPCFFTAATQACISRPADMLLVYSSPCEFVYVLGRAVASMARVMRWCSFAEQSRDSSVWPPRYTTMKAWSSSVAATH